jgi:hypothetical protein
MRLLFALLFLLAACPLAMLLAPPAPAPTLTRVPPPMPEPHIDITAEPETIHVGGTVTITGVPANIGLPYYTLTLTSGASITVTYDNAVRASSGDALFEVVAARGEMNRVVFTLRALAPGSAQAVISATGEVRVHDQAFSWGGGSSSAVTLVVADS